MNLQSMLESYGLQDDWMVVQEDTMELQCRHCGAIVSAEVIDLHRCNQ